MYWQEMTTKTFADHAVGHMDTVLIPVGSVQAHGLHLPLGSDSYVPEALCRRLEAHFPDRVLIAPTLAYGHSWGLARWPGTISLSSRLVAAYASEVGEQLAGWGMRHVVFINGHGGNIGPLTEAMERVAEVGSRAVLINWWIDFRDDILQVVTETGHASEDETSVMLAVRQDLVRMGDAESNPYRLRRVLVISEDLLDKAMRHAVAGNPKRGSREKGEAILKTVEQRLVQLMEDVWADRLFEETRGTTDGSTENH